METISSSTIDAIDDVGKAFTSLSGYKSVRGRSILATISSNDVPLWKWSTCILNFKLDNIVIKVQQARGVASNIR
jgi:hypothetical protein